MTIKVETLLRTKLAAIQADIAEALATPLDETNYRIIQQTLKVKDIQLELLYELIEEAF